MHASRFRKFLSLGLLLGAACSPPYNQNAPWGFLFLSDPAGSSDSSTTAASIDAYSDLILAESSLLAFWRLNESANPVTDSKGSNSGTLLGTGSSTTTASATAANDADNAVCLSETGTNRIEFPNNAALEFTTGQSVTVEAWFYPTALNQTMDLLAQGRTAGSENPNYALRINGAKVGFFFGDSGHATNVAAYRTDDYILKPNNWYHIVATHTYGSIADTEIYVNGIQRNGSWVVGAGNETPDVPGEPLWIGASDGPAGGSPDNIVGGCVDDVAIYNSVLALSSVREHYRVAKNRFVKLLPARWVLGASDTLFLERDGGAAPFSYSIQSGGGSVSSTGLFTAPAAMDTTVVRVTDGNGDVDEVTLRSFREPDDVANLGLWLKADSLTNAHNTAVTSWADQSGNGNDAASSTFDPDFNEGIRNGLPAVVFTAASTDYLELPGITWDPSTQVFTILAVFSVSLGTGAHEVVLQQAGGGRRLLWVNNASSRANTRVDATSVVHTTAVSANTALQYSVVWDLANLELYNLGAQVDSQVRTGESYAGAWRIGASGLPNQYLDGGIAEIILYDSNLSVADREAVECYIGEKYNFTMDAGHGCP